MFSPQPAAAGRTLTATAEAGRAETIWFPFAAKPWLEGLNKPAPYDSSRSWPVQHHLLQTTFKGCPTCWRRSGTKPPGTPHSSKLQYDRVMGGATLGPTWEPGPAAAASSPAFARHANVAAGADPASRRTAGDQQDYLQYRTMVTPPTRQRLLPHSRPWPVEFASADSTNDSRSFPGAQIAIGDPSAPDIGWDVQRSGWTSPQACPCPPDKCLHHGSGPGC